MSYESLRTRERSKQTILIDVGRAEILLNNSDRKNVSRQAFGNSTTPTPLLQEKQMSYESLRTRERSKQTILIDVGREEISAE